MTTKAEPLWVCEKAGECPATYICPHAKKHEHSKRCVSTSMEAGAGCDSCIPVPQEGEEER